MARQPYAGAAMPRGSRPAAAIHYDLAAPRNITRVAALRKLSAAFFLLQCRKCRMPVNAIAMFLSSAEAMTSASRTEPPG